MAVFPHSLSWADKKWFAFDRETFGYLSLYQPLQTFLEGKEHSLLRPQAAELQTETSSGIPLSFALSSQEIDS